MRADARPGPLGRRNGGPDLQGAEGSKRVSRNLAAGGDCRGWGGAPVCHAGRPELLVRRGSGRPRGEHVTGLDAHLDVRARNQPTSLLPAGMVVGARVRDERGGAAFPVGLGRRRRDRARVPVRPRAGLPSRGPRRRRAGGAQSVHDLVLPGGPRVHAAGCAVRGLAAVLCARLARSDPRKHRRLGRVLGAGGADAFVRGLPRGARGTVAPLRDPYATDRDRRRGSRRRPGAAPAAAVHARHEQPARLHQLDAAERPDPAGTGRLRPGNLVREPARALRVARRSAAGRGGDRIAGDRIRRPAAARRRGRRGPGRGRAVRAAGPGAAGRGLLHLPGADPRVDPARGGGRRGLHGAADARRRRRAPSRAARQLRLRPGAHRVQRAVSAPGLARGSPGARDRATGRPGDRRLRRRARVRPACHLPARRPMDPDRRRQHDRARDRRRRPRLAVDRPSAPAGSAADRHQEGGRLPGGALRDRASAAPHPNADRHRGAQPARSSAPVRARARCSAPAERSAA